MTVADTRTLLNEMFDHYADTRDRIWNQSQVAHNVDFEKALVKIQGHREDELIVKERASMVRF